MTAKYDEVHNYSNMSQITALFYSWCTSQSKVAVYYTVTLSTAASPLNRHPLGIITQSELYHNLYPTSIFTWCMLGGKGGRGGGGCKLCLFTISQGNPRTVITNIPHTLVKLVSIVLKRMFLRWILDI